MEEEKIQIITTTNNYLSSMDGISCPNSNVTFLTMSSGCFQSVSPACGLWLMGSEDDILHRLECISISLVGQFSARPTVGNHHFCSAIPTRRDWETCYCYCLSSMWLWSVFSYSFDLSLGLAGEKLLFLKLPQRMWDMIKQSFDKI